jgi:hypothetical protein
VKFYQYVAPAASLSRYSGAPFWTRKNENEACGQLQVLVSLPATESSQNTFLNLQLCCGGKIHGLRVFSRFGRISRLKA